MLDISWKNVHSGLSYYKLLFQYSLPETFDFMEPINYLELLAY